MKPVLVQHLIKQRGKYKPSPLSKEEEQKLNDRAASVALWAVGLIVLISLIAL